MTIVAFDLDGMLSQSDVPVLPGRECDVAGEIRRLDWAFHGEGTFASTLSRRVSLLDGLPKARVDAVFERPPVPVFRSTQSR